jgi:alpha-galactosidase
VLHAGDWSGLDHPDAGIVAQMVVQGNKALGVAAQTGFSPIFDAAPLRLKGLEADTLYRVTLPRPWPSKAALYLPDWQRWEAGLTLSGRALMTQGLALPLTHPETAWLVALERLPQ